jgi:hypothetical protein
MQIVSTDSTFFVYLERDEPVLATLTDVCRRHQIQAGWVTGIGAVKAVELGVYDLKTRTYTRRMFPETHELVSFQGNIALKDGEPFIHAHITIGNHDFELVGGHLFEMQVAVVGEFIIRKREVTVRRELDPEIGLATWCLAGS